MEQKWGELGEEAIELLGGDQYRSCKPWEVTAGALAFTMRWELWEGSEQRGDMIYLLM